jgi:hypothetical protein
METTEILKAPPSSSELIGNTIVDDIIKIVQFSTLPDNWDSEGAKAVPIEVCEKAAKYLYAAHQELAAEFKSAAPNFPGSFEEPHKRFVAPGGDGSIVIEWESDKAELIVVFRPGGQQLDVEYLTVEKKNGKEFEKEGFLNSATAFVEAVRWFYMYKD